MRTRLVRCIVIAVCLGKAGRVVSQCPNTTVDLTVNPPTLAPISVGDQYIRGTVPAGTTGTVQVCLNAKAVGTPQPIAADDSFVISLAGALKTTDVVTAQVVNGSGKYSPPAPNAVADSCAADASTPAAATSAPVLNSVTTTRYNGSVPGAKSGSVRICINDKPLAGSQGISTIGNDGSFSGTDVGISVGDKVSAQSFTSASGKNTYGPLSAVVVATAHRSQAITTVIAIAGVEQSGYSSLGQNTNPFVNFSLIGPLAKGWGGWGRVRLLGAPQPSTQGIVSTFTDPTGQLTTQDYSKVGESLDFVVGSVLKITDRSSATEGWALITGVGATTTLSSQSVALTYKAPAPGTVECTTLTGRFTIANGYAPGLTQAPSGSATCLAGGYTDVAFSNQDRSNFLSKWGVGVRTSAKFPCSNTSTCPPAYGVLDLTVGQDESITRGLLRHFVLKLDGVLPLSMGGNSSFLYLFGSVYMRTSRNQDLSPLILQTETATVTLPSSTVIVLPLQQPDRDFYRLGVGLNLNQVFCKMFSSTCPSNGSAAPATTTPASTAPATTTTN